MLTGQGEARGRTSEKSREPRGQRATGDGPRVPTVREDQMGQGPLSSSHPAGEESEDGEVTDSEQCPRILTSLDPSNV